MYEGRRQKAAAAAAGSAAAAAAKAAADAAAAASHPCAHVNRRLSTELNFADYGFAVSPGCGSIMSIAPWRAW